MTTDLNKLPPVGDRESTVRVLILGQEYPVRADADADYIREIAAFLDERLRIIQRLEPERPPMKIAILAALNLADEVFRLRREKLELSDRCERKLREFTDHLDRELLE